MCKRCVIFTYDEVLDIVQRLEVGAPLNVEPDWPARSPEAFPKSVAPLIVPRFDTAGSSFPLTPGTLGVYPLSWGFEESWKQGVVFNTRIESALKPTWRESMEHRRCVIPVRSFFETHRDETVPSPKTGKPIERQYEFRVPGQDVIFIGCIWRVSSFSMVTTSANSAMTPIHDRMPLVIRREELPLWFGPDYQQLANRAGVRLDAFPAQ